METAESRLCAHAQPGPGRKLSHREKGSYSNLFPTLAKATPKGILAQGGQRPLPQPSSPWTAIPAHPPGWAV